MPQANAGSKITATGGASAIEGAAGGGIIPWGVINGYDSSGEWGASLFATRVTVDDFDLSVYGASAAFGDRVEVSLARQTFDVEPLGVELEQDIFGAKVRIAGALLYTRMPQITFGVQHKRLVDDAIPTLLVTSSVRSLRTCLPLLSTIGKIGLLVTFPTSKLLWSLLMQT